MERFSIWKSKHTNVRSEQEDASDTRGPLPQIKRMPTEARFSASFHLGCSRAKPKIKPRISYMRSSKKSSNAQVKKLQTISHHHRHHRQLFVKTMRTRNPSNISPKNQIQKYKIHDPAEQVRSPADRQRTPPWSDEEERRPCRKQKVAQPTQNLEELYWNLHISTERTIDSTAKAQKREIVLMASVVLKPRKRMKEAHSVQVVNVT